MTKSIKAWVHPRRNKTVVFLPTDIHAMVAFEQPEWFDTERADTEFEMLEKLLKLGWIRAGVSVSPRGNQFYTLADGSEIDLPAHRRVVQILMKKTGLEPTSIYVEGTGSHHAYTSPMEIRSFLQPVVNEAQHRYMSKYWVCPETKQVELVDMPFHIDAVDADPSRFGLSKTDELSYANMARHGWVRSSIVNENTDTTYYIDIDGMTVRDGWKATRLLMNKTKLEPTILVIGNEIQLFRDSQIRAFLKYGRISKSKLVMETEETIFRPLKIWYNTRTDKVIDVPKGSHHVMYVREHPELFGIDPEGGDFAGRAIHAGWVRSGAEFTFLRMGRSLFTEERDPRLAHKIITYLMKRTDTYPSELIIADRWIKDPEQIEVFLKKQRLPMRVN